MSIQLTPVYGCVSCMKASKQAISASAFKRAQQVYACSSLEQPIYYFCRAYEFKLLSEWNNYAKESLLTKHSSFWSYNSGYSLGHPGATQQQQFERRPTNIIVWLSINNQPINQCKPNAAWSTSVYFKTRTCIQGSNHHWRCWSDDNFEALFDYLIAAPPLD